MCGGQPVDNQRAEPPPKGPLSHRRNPGSAGDASFFIFFSVTRNSFPPELLLNLDWWRT